MRTNDKVKHAVDKSFMSNQYFWDRPEARSETPLQRIRPLAR